MTFEKFIALIAMILFSQTWHLVLMWYAWGLWPIHLGWFAAGYPGTVILAAAVFKLLEPKK